MNWSEGVKLIAGAAGAFFAAWAGAQAGFRRAKRERALDRRITWHEQTIQALAKYEERLERLHGYFRFVLLIKPAAAKEPDSGRIPETIKVPQGLWAELQAAEESARAGLRLADVFTDLRTQVECSTALAHTVNVVSSQWTDISPEPEISWADLSVKALRVGTVRTSIQDSMKRVLEMDGFLASIAPWYARWRLIRRIEKMQREIGHSAS